MRVRRFRCPVAGYKTLSEIIIVLDRKYSNPRHSLWRNSLTASGEFMAHWLIAEFTPRPLWSCDGPVIYFPINTSLVSDSFLTFKSVLCLSIA